MATLNHSFTETCNRLRRHVFGSAPLRQRFDSFSSKFGRVNSPKPQDIAPETAVVDVVTQPPTTTDVEPSPSCSTDVDHPSPSPSIAERPSSPPPDRSIPLSSSHPDRSVLTSVLDMGAPPTSTFPYKEMVDFLVLKASIDHVEKDDLQINLKSAREECGRLTTERQTLQSTIRELSLEVERLRGYASRQRELEEDQRKEIARLEEDHLAKSELERRLRATEMELLDRMAEFSKCQREAEEIYLSLQAERERTVALEEKLDFLNRQQSTTTVGTIVNSEEQDTPLAVAPPPLRDHHVPVYFVKNHGTPVANQHIINVLCTLPTLSKGYTLIFCDPLLLESLFVQAFQNNPLPSLPFVIKANADLESFILHLQEVSQDVGVIIATCFFNKEEYQILQRTVKVEKIIFYPLLLNPESGGEAVQAMKVLRGVPASSNRTVFIGVLTESDTHNHFKVSGFSKTRPFELTEALLTAPAFWGKLGVL